MRQSKITVCMRTMPMRRMVLSNTTHHHAMKILMKLSQGIELLQTNMLKEMNFINRKIVFDITYLWQIIYSYYVLNVYFINNFLKVDKLIISVKINSTLLY